MKTMKKIVLMALAMVMTVSGCKAGEQTESNEKKTAGGLVRENREVGNFTGISLIGSCRVVCTLDTKASVVVETPKQELEKLQTEVKNGVLTISRKKIAGVRVIYGKDDERTTVYVTVPTLKKVSLVGSGDIVVKGKVKSDGVLDVSLSGSGDIEMGDVDAHYVKFSLAGSGDVKVGNVKSPQVELSLAGSGDIAVKSVDAELAAVNLAGSGDVQVGLVKASDVAAVRMAGSGDMTIDRVDCGRLDISQLSSSDLRLKAVKATITKVSKSGSGSLWISGTTGAYEKVVRGNGVYDKKLIRQTEGRPRTVSTSSPNGIEAQP